ncbi:PKD domain containing protein [Opitutaceae bacterium EW11]|nr:PKD domain containing protein [Opitutaceae bacterium EW11]
MMFRPLRFLVATLVLAPTVRAFDRPDVTFPVFQFPADKIPRIDGKADDWAMVPESYVVGSDQLVDAGKKHEKMDPKDLDVRVRVGWVKGLNRLYFLYEAYDNFWDFSRPDLHNDTLELVVDGDASGGPFVGPQQKSVWTAEDVGVRRAEADPRMRPEEIEWAIHGVHAQNYHVFTPAVGKEWALAWGAATWIKDLPWANAAASFDFKPGEPGRLVLEFWITPFDYAGPEGPQRAVESVLWEDKLIGLGWIVIDYDNPASKANNGFWMLSRHRTMLGDASDLPAFRLMPLEPQFQKKLEAHWTFKVVDPDRRLVAFIDQSAGKVTSWHWDFGDGTTSTEQHPIHAYSDPGPRVVVLEVEGPDGKSRWSRIRDVQLK